ncbi:MAG: hypothetical protein JXQ87_08555 [Bacteroidia bacterium]
MSDFLKYGAIAAALVLLFFQMQKAAAKELSKSQLQEKIGLISIYKIIGAVALIIGIGASAAVLVSNEENKVLLALVFIVLFGVLGSITLLISIKTWFQFSKDELASNTLFGGEQTLKWNDIEDIRFNSFSSSIVFYGAGDTKVKLHIHTRGIKQILTVMQQKTGKSPKDVGFNYPLDK